MQADLDAGVLKREVKADRAQHTLDYARWLRIVLPLCLIVLAILVFMPALDADFSRWDDDDLVHRQRDHLSFSMDNLSWMFTTTFSGHYQPLTWISYAIDYKLFSLDPFGFHLTSVVFHVLTMCVFYILARRLLALGTDNVYSSDSVPVMLAGAFAAFVFGIHPLRAESVAWIAERRDVISGFFFVIAVLCYVQYAAWKSGVSTPPQASRHDSVYRWYYTASVASCVLSLLAKASAMTIPLVLLILDVFPLKRFNRNRLQRAGGWRLLCMEKLPFLLIAMAAGIMAVAAQSANGAMHSLTEHDLAARLAQACYGLMFYLWKTVCPIGLGPLYEIPAREVLVGRLLWVSLPVVALLVVVTTWQARRRPALAAALLYYLVVVSPVLGLVQSGPQLVADRYSYLSCLGLAVLAGAVLLAVLRHRSAARESRFRAGMILVVGLVVAGLLQSTTNQAAVWESPLTLWFRGVQVSPHSAIAKVNYADALSMTPQGFAGAESFYRQALAIKPNDSVGLHHYADLLNRSGRREEAIRYYIRSLAIDPSRPRACLSLGRVFVEMGRPHLALTVLRDGAKRNPDALELNEYLARLLATHADEDIRNGREALALAQHVYGARKEYHLDSMVTLAYALAETGKFDLAIAMGRHVVQIAEFRGFHQLAASMSRQLVLFQSGKAYHGGP